jgi:metal-sulfur cluster biosynthetic enzyme
MTVSEGAVFEALKCVLDPELHVNIVDLGLIYLVDVTDGEDGRSTVRIEMTMTSPACPAAPQLVQETRDVVSRMDAVGHVDVKVVMTPPWTPDRMTDDARDELDLF